MLLLNHSHRSSSSSGGWLLRRRFINIPVQLLLVFRFTFATVNIWHFCCSLVVQHIYCRFYLANIKTNFKRHHRICNLTQKKRKYWRSKLWQRIVIRNTLKMLAQEQRECGCKRASEHFVQRDYKTLYFPLETRQLHYFPLSYFSLNKQRIN